MLGDTTTGSRSPNVPGQTPELHARKARPTVDSATLDATSARATATRVLSLRAQLGATSTTRSSLFTRWTSLHYPPDPVGDLVFNGIAADIIRSNSRQRPAGRRELPRWARRTRCACGLFVQRENFTVDNTSAVFPADAGRQPDQRRPIQIEDDTRMKGHLWGVYVQDEWRPTSALTVNYGLRFDKVDAVVNESQLSPRIGLVYEASTRPALHAGYSRYFTPPPTEKIDTTRCRSSSGTTNALPSDANTAGQVRALELLRRGRRLPADAAGQRWASTATTAASSTCRTRASSATRLIFSAFNYAKGQISGLELSTTYHDKRLSGYASLSLHAGPGQDRRDGAVQLRSRRAGLHRLELGPPRPRAAPVRIGRHRLSVGDRTTLSGRRALSAAACATASPTPSTCRATRRSISPPSARSTWAPVLARSAAGWRCSTCSIGSTSCATAPESESARRSSGRGERSSWE